MRPDHQRQQKHIFKKKIRQTLKNTIHIKIVKADIKYILC